MLKILIILLTIGYSTNYTKIITPFQEEGPQIETKLETEEYYYFYDEDGTYWRTDGINYWYWKNGKWRKSNPGHQPPENQTPINEGTIFLLCLGLIYSLKKLNLKNENTLD